MLPLHTLNNPNAYGTSEYDNFGHSVASSGDYVVVGAPGEDDSDIGGDNSGKAYIFSVSTGSLLRTLNNPNAYGISGGDQFGYSVAVSGDYVVVGAPYENDSGGVDSGKAYIFSASTGALLHTLDNPNAYGTSANDGFGFAVAISGDYVVVSAPYEDDSGGSNSGKVHIFSVSTGSLLRTLNNPNAYGTSAGDVFGELVAVSGDYVVVGAYWEDDSGGATSGKAYIFSASTGALLHTLNNPNAYGTSAGDVFGNYVAVSGDYVVVSASHEDDSGGANSGKAYIFSASTGSLLRTLNNPNAYGTSAYDNFGWPVAISGDSVFVGAPGEDDSEGDDSGKAYIFSASTGALLHTLDNPNAYGTSAYDNFGGPVAISGNYVVVGVPYEGDSGGYESGKAYVFYLAPPIYGFWERFIETTETLE